MKKQNPSNIVVSEIVVNYVSIFFGRCYTISLGVLTPKKEHSRGPWVPNLDPTLRYDLPWLEGLSQHLWQTQTTLAWDWADLDTFSMSIHVNPSKSWESFRINRCIIVCIYIYRELKFLVLHQAAVSSCWDSEVILQHHLDVNGWINPWGPMRKHRFTKRFTSLNVNRRDEIPKNPEDGRNKHIEASTYHILSKVLISKYQVACIGCNVGRYHNRLLFATPPVSTAHPFLALCGPLTYWKFAPNQDFYICN